MVDPTEFLGNMRQLLGDLTFAEAYARTGRLVNITASTPQLGNALLLNYIITPNVLVASAVQVSCALTGFMRPGTLLSKDADGAIKEYSSGGLLFRDGSFQADVPTEELATQFHATHFIVSQANPHISPFVYDPLQPCSPLAQLQRALQGKVGTWLLNQKQVRKRAFQAWSIASVTAQPSARARHSTHAVPPFAPASISPSRDPNRRGDCRRRSRIWCSATAAAAPTSRWPHPRGRETSLSGFSPSRRRTACKASLREGSA